jgi:asparagine synthase (glutamine-hydrolysing)
LCGIAGIMMLHGRRPEPSILDRLSKALTHRGPDDAGQYEDRSVGLINTRLAIVDLVSGHQPLEAPDGTVLVANGEIYNDPDIRRKLSDTGYKTGSDCESALHLYRQQGLDFTKALRGMYAIAIYDKAKSQLILARDPFGIKQLYYVTTPDCFAFASEPQALMAAGLAQRHIRPQKRSELLQLKFTTGPDTIFAHINRLLPGETIIVANGQIVERRRQHVIPQNRSSTTRNEDSSQRLDAMLTDSVRAHVRSDVPYGLFLSGGIDSSCLLALMARVSSSPVLALTAAFPDSRAVDESKLARRAAKAVGADIHIVEVRQEDFWRSAPRVAAAMDDPTTDAAALPTFLLGNAAKAQHIKVVLSGEGADEVFGGYSRYRRAVWLWGLLSRKSRSRGVFDDMVDKNRDHPFEHWRDGLRKTEEEEASPYWSPMQRLQAIDCAEWLPNDLLVKLDRCLMAHGVEGRTPFLDPELTPFAFGLPDNTKVKDGFGKWLLRNWLSKNLPEAEAFARKTGFNPPVGEWIAHCKMDMAALVLSQPGIAEMSIGGIVHAVFDDPIKHSQAAWNLVFYALWHSHHVLGIASDGSIGDVLSVAARRG